ncbi:hypothetical protein G7046_g919 [Stylonectria norvegica]|nr:hypothetical protein G7046_g919 [Stylonectria norvegica]
MSLDTIRQTIMARLRKIYNYLGFMKGYNFTLWLIFGSGFAGFAAARLLYLDFDGALCPSHPPKAPFGSRGAVPGECYFYQSLEGKIGIMIHLAGILPAAILVIFQFVPAIRHKFLLLHRINGYIILLLSWVSAAGILMIARNTFGGGVDMQTVTGLATLLFLACLALAIYNIKQLQVEQHRAWMLRAWVIAGFIITMRILSTMMAMITSATGPYYTVRTCAVVDYIYHHDQTTVEALYPDCVAYYTGKAPDQAVMIQGDVTSSQPEQLASSLNVNFGAAAWLALIIHCIAVELYLRLTPVEAERLRRVSYEKQLETGMKTPGNAGTTAQRLGDARPWICPQSQAPNEQRDLSSTDLGSRTPTEPDVRLR